MPCATDSVILVSKSIVYPDANSTIGDLKLSVSDLPMLSCHYIQKGCLFTRPPISIDALITSLKRALSKTLSCFPPLAGRFITDPDGYVYVSCNDAGAEFVFAKGTCYSARDVLSPSDLPELIRGFFSFDRTVSYSGHEQPILAVQVTELSDGVFIGCSMNHAVSDGTSLWNFFNTFAEHSRGVKRISFMPDFSRDSVLISPAVLQVPEGGPRVTFNESEPLREKIFSFSREVIMELKAKVNKTRNGVKSEIDNIDWFGKQGNNKCYDKDFIKLTEMTESLFCKNAPVSKLQVSETVMEISSFQSLCALLWRAITRARNLPDSKTTTFRMAVNCRHRLSPQLDTCYFGNAIQSVPTYATAGDVLSRDLRWCAEQLNKNVNAHNDTTVRRLVKVWEGSPRCFPLGNFDGASITMGSSPRFPMYDNDFGWGRPLAVRSGRANKFDGKISAFPGRSGNGSVDLEVVLAPETMAAIECDREFMQYAC